MSPDLFRGVVAFVAAAEEKTFRAAGVRLGVSTAAISKAIAALEADTGAALFNRTGRSVELTREGALFLEHCRPAVSAVSAGRSALDAGRRLPQGELVLTAPFVAASLVIPAIASMRERHPRLSFTLRITDRVAKLGEEGVDVAVRIGHFPSSELVARRLRATELWTVASPVYIARASLPRRIEDLEAHACISTVGPRGKPFAWLFDAGPREVPAVLVVDYAPAALDAALLGLGVTQVFDFMAEQHVREGRLLRLLGERTGQGPDVIAVCSPGQRASARVRVAFEAFAETMTRR